MARRNKKTVQRKDNPVRNRSESKSDNYTKDRNSKVPNGDSGKDKEENSKALSKEEQEAMNKGHWRSASESDRAANDPEWYNADPQLLLDSASFPYAYPFGDIIEFLERGTHPSIGGITVEEGNYPNYAIPGICSLSVKPTLGYSFNRNDAANVCANAFFTHVRVANSGRKNYEAVDLMMYALSIAELYSFIFWCERLYGFMFTYSQRNKYLARAFLEANGVKYDSMLSNLANFRYWLNAFINKVCAWVVPADINIFKRRAFMYSSIYLENGDSNIKDQMYQFVPDGFYRFQLDEESRGKLHYKKLSEWMDSGELLEVATIFNIGDWLIANITGDEDFAIMSGDILKAYGTERIIGLGAMPEEVYILPVYDAFVLSQFKNATVVDTYRGEDAPYLREHDDTDFIFPSGDICQDNHGNIICYELLNTSRPNDIAASYARKILSVENPTPGPADSIEASRFLFSVDTADSPFQMNVTKDGWQSTSIVPKFTCGCDYITNIKISIYGEDSNYWPSMLVFNYNSNVFNIPYEMSSEQALMMMMLTMFKYLPNRFMMMDSGSERAASLRLTSNVDNYTLLTYNEVQKMHECALLSLFFVPGVAKMVNYL